MRRNVIATLAAVLSLAGWAALAQPAGAVSGGGTVATNAREGVLINGSVTATGSHLGTNNGHCTGVLVTTPNQTPAGDTETRAVLTAGHCIYRGAGQTPYLHWDVGAPYAPENATHPAFGLKVVHSVDEREGRRWMAEPYPDFYRWDGNTLTSDTPTNLLSLHDVGLICLDQPVKTQLPVLDTRTVIQPLNTTEADTTTVVAVGRVNNVDPRYPPGLGKYQDLFRTDDLQTGAIAAQDYGPESPLWIHNEFIVPTSPVTPVDPGDSGGPAFLAGTHTVVGVTEGDFKEFNGSGAESRWAVGFSRLSDPAVAAWLTKGINSCNNGKSHSLPRPPLPLPS